MVVQREREGDMKKVKFVGRGGNNMYHTVIIIIIVEHKDWTGVW